MSAPSDGARGDARKARAAHVEEGHDTRCEREYTENGFIFIDCLCSLRKAKAEAWHEGRNENQAIWEAELPRLIADAKAEALREAAAEYSAALPSHDWVRGWLTNRAATQESGR